MNYNDDEKYCKDCHILPGIHCDAKNCIHHGGEYNCTADKIAVGPRSATSSDETECATFKQKEF